MSAWRVSWKGPMAALQVYLMEMLDDWIRPQTRITPPNQLNLEFPWPYLQRQLHAEQQRQKARRIQELDGCLDSRVASYPRRR